jgi:TatD DNase family protein
VSDRFIDSHAHLDHFASEIDSVLERARSAGITDIVSIGASEGFDSNPKTLDLVLAHAEGTPRLYATVGIHPHDARLADRECLDRVSALAENARVVAVGETGLDYHYDHSPRDQQKEAFRAQLSMARTLKKPAVIHTREAEDDTIAILREERAHEIGGVIHCFTGTAKLASAAVDFGFYVSFSGVLTFRNADPIREVARSLPHDRVLVETDCPFLAPIPFRGKRNEPSYVVHTAKMLADLWGMPELDVRKRTGENAASLFALSRDT